MAKINLLPWREELRQQKKKEFLTMLGLSALLSAILVGFVHMIIEGKKEYRGQRNKMIETEMAELDKKIVEVKSIGEKKSQLLAKIDVVQRLQESRPEIVHLFDELPRVTPDGVFLNKFEQKGQALSFYGKTQSNARVSAFMRAIDASQWLQTPKLEVIRSSDKRSVEQDSEFTMHANLGLKKPDSTGKR